MDAAHSRTQGIRGVIGNRTVIQLKTTCYITRQNVLSELIATYWLYFAQRLLRTGVRTKRTAQSGCYIRYTILGVKSRQGFVRSGVAESEFLKKVLYFRRQEANGAGKQGKNVRSRVGVLRLCSGPSVISDVAGNRAAELVNWPGLIDTGARKGLI